MENLQNREEHINYLEALAHKLLLVGRVMRLGDKTDHMYTPDDLQFLQEIHDKDPNKVREELLQEMWYSSHSSHNSHKHINYSAG